MLGHLSFGVADLERAITFYDAALAPLGLTRVWTGPSAAGYGYPGGGDLFAVKQRDGAGPPGDGFHLAYNAASRAAVDKFYAASLQAGGADNGSPGLRPQYGLSYYAAFVIDLDGYPIEVVCKTGD